MLARIQQFTTLMLLAASGAWAWYWLPERPLLASVGALVIVFGYALVLGLEFVLLYAVHADDPAPKAGALALLRAWWGEVRTTPRVFCWRQPFRSQAEPDHLPATAHGRRGVLLVHGFVCNRGLWNPWMRDLRRRGVPFIAVNLEPVFGGIDDYPDLIEAAVLRLEAATGLAPVVVGHSMGGLALRAWLAAYRAHGRVHRIVTIGTPHRGTWLARYAHTLNSRQMLPGGAWLRQLEASESPTLAAHCTCFYSHCDNIVFPASTATLPHADNRHLPGTAHVHMAFQPLVFSEVLRWLSATDGVRAEPAAATAR